MTDDTQPTAMDAGLVLRLRHALTGSSESLHESVRDPSVDVLLAALKNPALAVEHLLVLLRRPDLTEQVVTAVSRTALFEEHHPLRAAVFRHPATPTPLAISLVPRLHLFELMDAILMPAVPPDHRIAAERAVVQRLPSVPLGARITLARRATGAIVEALLSEGDSRLVDACLGNPRLAEGGIARLLSGGRATAEVISAIARHDRWKTRPNLRRAILRNPRTPLVWFTLWLPTMPMMEMRELLLSPRLTAPQKQAVREVLERRQGRGVGQKKS
jgi:hypothetical protein